MIFDLLAEHLDSAKSLTIAISYPRGHGWGCHELGHHICRFGVVKEGAEALDRVNA
jgi:hypothetical protein